MNQKVKYIALNKEKSIITKKVHNLKTTTIKTLHYEGIVNIDCEGNRILMINVFNMKIKTKPVEIKI